MTSGDEGRAALEEARRLYRAGRHAEGEAFTARAVADHPGSAELWNVRGVFLRQLGRLEDARQALERAVALKPDFAGARTNLANVTVDLAAAAEHHQGVRAAIHLLDEAIARDPDNIVLLEAKALFVRRSADRPLMVAYFEELAAQLPEAAWAQIYLADVIGEDEPARAEALLRRALALDPDGLAPKVALLQRLARTAGPREGQNVDEAYALALAAMEHEGLNPTQLKLVCNALSRTCDFAAMDRLGSFRTLGRPWAEAGLHTALLMQLPRVRTHADRVELLQQHRIAGEVMMRAAEPRPIARRPRTPGPRTRLGFLSADLRRHPVGYFVEPLFRYPSDRFELFVYALDPAEGDTLQAWFAERASAFRRMPNAHERDIAQAIADDDLDVLVELGGSTAMNRLEALAWRPAPLQLSWLGYPHSAGLPAIDGLICDPWNRPPDPALLAEATLVMPRTWIALGEKSFPDAPVTQQLPEARFGALTFGTANKPYKYTPEALELWAEITAAAAPDARFVFIRPESASAAFRRHVLSAFAKHDVAEDRVIFHAVRGAHLPFYNEVDICLDTFPLTGGTTTVEALWMGVPVVSLRGEAFFERLSASILANAGLEDLIADDQADYRAKALALAADAGRRAELRAGLRARLRAGPLGDGEAFARDFFDLMARTVAAGAGVRS